MSQTAASKIGAAVRLQRSVGAADRERLDQYFTSLRELEKQLARDVTWAKTPKPRVDPRVAAEFRTSMDLDRKPFDYRAYASTMYDLIALAWQTDSTRVVLFLDVVREMWPGTADRDAWAGWSVEIVDAHGHVVRVLAL